MDMDIDGIVGTVRNFPGITRKHPIQEVVGYLPTADFSNVLASAGEDAAVIKNGDECILFAADGIMESLMKTNPYYAGYFAVLVNVNDIAAMGGMPLAMVDIVSIKDNRICTQVLKGMERAVRKFKVPIVGGHTHPDCAYNAIDVSIIGTAPCDEVIYSHTARVGDDIVFVMDLDGFYPPELPLAWDTTTVKDDELVRRQILVMRQIGKEKLATAAKDMSNPGALGTLGMLLETSGKGARVDLAKVPRPNEVDFTQWLISYQGCGFAITCSPSSSARILELFSEVGMDGAVVGGIEKGRKFVVHHGSEERILFDFETDKITGCIRKG